MLSNNVENFAIFDATTDASLPAYTLQGIFASTSKSFEFMHPVTSSLDFLTLFSDQVHQFQCNLWFHRSESICQIVRKSAITANPDMTISKNRYRCMLQWSSNCDPFWWLAVINLDSHSFEQKLHYYRPYLSKETQQCTCRWLQIFFFCCCYTCHPAFSITWPKSLWNQRSFSLFSGA